MAHHDRFVRGAMERHPDVDEALAERVWGMVVGFSGLRLPEGPRRGVRPARLPVDLAARPPPARVRLRPARRAADGLLPTRLADPRGPAPRPRGPPARHQRSESCAASRTSAHAAGGTRACARHGDRATPARSSAIRVGLGYVLGVRADEVAALVAAREEGGPFRSLEDLASRAGAGRAALDRLAWSGACDALAGDRRTALWQLGVAAPGRRMDGGGVQLSLPLGLPAPPRLRPLGAWEEMLADYGTTGVSARDAPDGSCCGPRSPNAPDGHERRPRPPRSTARPSGSPASSSRASGRGPRRASCSCSSRTSSGRSTSSSRPRSTSATASPCASSRSSSPRASSSASRPRAASVNILVRRLDRARPPRRRARRHPPAPGRDRRHRARAAAESPRARRARRSSPAVAAAGGGDFRAVAPPVMSFARGPLPVSPSERRRIARADLHG